MPNKAPVDPQNIWQQQATEVFTMSADQLRHKVLQDQNIARVKAAYSTILGVILFVLFARAFAIGHDVVPRIGWGVLSLWCIYYAYQSSKGIGRGQITADATLRTTVESYRSRLEKRRDYIRHIWRKAGLPFCFLGMAIVLAPALINSFEDPKLLLKAAPVLVLFVVWLAVFLPSRKRQQRKLQQEIDQLLAFERENRL
ncbi:MAG: hypothetical protein WA477_13310 [Candidatus Sulfotelmatobacter sp.]